MLRRHKLLRNYVNPRMNDIQGVSKLRSDFLFA